MFDPNQIGATVIFVVTIAISLFGLFSSSAVIEKSLFRPYWFLREREYATVFTSGLVHADMGHLLMNMFTFFFFAFSLEDRIGSGKFVVLYVLQVTRRMVIRFY